MKTTLKVDIDSKPYRGIEFDKRLVLLGKELNLKRIDVKLSSTKKGSHVIVVLNDIYLREEMIIACQLYLGSDIYRELFNIGRIFRGETENWNVLFSRKWKNNTCISREFRRRTYTIKIREGKNATKNIK